MLLMAGTRIVIDRISLGNFFRSLLDAQVLVDPIPHLGRIDGEGKVWKGLFGDGGRVQGEIIGESGLTAGNRVLYRRER